MKLVIEIPEEFVEHFNNDRFEDSLMQVEVDIENRESMLSGLYEIELIAMLRNALNNAVEE
jgi:hypothetical protein